MATQGLPMFPIRSIPRQLMLMGALVAALPALGAAINGTLKRGNAPLPPATLRLQCGSATSEGHSDNQGHYSLSIAASGLCTLTVNERNAATVLLGKSPVRYDFEVPTDAKALVQH
jgi:hypothetical protein